jgi:hypothetical protein
LPPKEAGTISNHITPGGNVNLNSRNSIIKEVGFYCVLLQLLSSSVCVCHGNKSAKTIALKEMLSIGASAGGTFVQVGEITADSRDNIYVTDEFQYKVKKFDSRGRFIQDYGKRGKKPGQFQAGPYKIVCIHDTLAIAGVGAASVQSFTNQFVPINEARLAGVIVDLCYTKQGLIYASTIQPPYKFENTLSLYTREGDAVSNLILKGGEKDPILDMTCVCVDGSDNLIVVFLFINRVIIYDAHQKYVTDFKIPSVPEEAMEEQDLNEFTSMPDNLFSDVAVDGKNNIFILAGPQSKHPNRDVYVMDYRGNLQTVFQLPDQSGVIFLDQKGCLFTREKKRSIVKKYEIIYINF